MVLRYRKFNEELFDRWRKKPKSVDPKVDPKVEWEKRWEEINKSVLEIFMKECYPNFMKKFFYTKYDWDKIKPLIRGTSVLDKFDNWIKIHKDHLENPFKKSFTSSNRDGVEKKHEKIEEIKHTITDCFQDVIDDLNLEVSYKYGEMANPILNMEFYTEFLTRSECKKFYDSRLSPIFGKLSDGYDIKKSLKPWILKRTDRTWDIIEVGEVEPDSKGFVYNGVLFIRNGSRTSIIITFINPYYEDFNY